MAGDGVRFVKKSLLSKYEMPIGHLSYEYIDSCDDVKELERIVTILRSGEEGVFPDLQRSAEDRLGTFCPNNRHLRVDMPVLTKDSMGKQEWDNYMEDFSKWKNEISETDLKLCEENGCLKDCVSAPVRNAKSFTKLSQEKRRVNDSAKVKRICDYASWDKYDVDCELLKMDLEEDKRDVKGREAIDREQDILVNINKEVEALTVTERRLLAEQQINRGNEYYAAKGFKEAVKCYSASIAVSPTAKAHNNRAACYLKLSKYSNALDDANAVLKMQPGNIKALFRRGIARQQKNMFEEALEDVNAVLKEEPTNVSAMQIADRLKDQVQKHLKAISSESASTEMRHCHERDFLHRPSTSRGLSERPANNVKIVELSEDPQPLKSTMEIVELDSNNIKLKPVVVDKRLMRAREQVEVNRSS